MNHDKHKNLCIFETVKKNIEASINLCFWTKFRSWHIIKISFEELRCWWAKRTLRP